MLFGNDPQSAATELGVAIRADQTDEGQRLDRVLALHLPALSRTRLKRLIEGGCVSETGIVLRDPSLRVRRDQNFVVVLPEAENAAPAAQSITLDIRFEDAHLIVIDKPAGMVVHPGPGNPDGTLVNALLGHCGPGLSGIGGVRRPGIVHRLDKDTSGLMVVAKTDAAHHGLSHDFAARQVERAYTAFVWGVPAPPAGEIAGNIGRSTVNRKKMAVLRDGRGKPAVTRYRVERAFQTYAAIVRCRLATGRTHQIRVHLAHFGHPLIGDPVYGTRAGRAIARGGPIGAGIAAFPRQALHAGLLGFTHPIEKQRLEFESAIPADLRELMKSLERL
ncbi:MAG: RluA family pseudouridine synthase [Alphaproteobacteria bacterium]|nr:RluA family pseudouridine synthase [Alphaproteobacteria bacterium]